MKPDFVIRPLARRDASGILTLESALSEDGRGLVRTPGEQPQDEAAMQRSLQPWLNGGPELGVYLVAAAGPGSVPILGAAELRRQPLLRVRHTASLALGVHPDHQRRGIGRALVTALFEWAAPAGIERIELDVLDDNPRAIRLYESLGFEHEGVRRRLARRAEGGFVDGRLMARLAPFDYLKRE